jgi:hypothetical protein
MLQNVQTGSEVHSVWHFAGPGVGVLSSRIEGPRQDPDPSRRYSADGENEWSYRRGQQSSSGYAKEKLAFVLYIYKKFI